MRAAVPSGPVGDVVVVGAGGAGLYAAACAARAGASVVLVSATPLADTASYWAQGGIAAALGPDDDAARHVADTEAAGRGLVRRSAAVALCDEAPAIVEDLRSLGVAFDADRNGTLALGLEGGHSRRRVVHAGGSATGRRVTRQLSAWLVASPAVTILEAARAASLWIDDDGSCRGVVTEEGIPVRGRGVVLACGGAAALWGRTTNPPGSVGVGLQLAAAAGAELADLEFVQFHPTAVTGVPGREGFLVTEAIRGEGARLLDPDGERFVEELAPRDEVAAAVWRVMRERRVAHVDLDMRGIDPARFPNVCGALAQSGLDTTRELVPVAPAAHYVMGGVVCGLDGGTRVPGLHCAGETACTGLHGANRLASNSLTECFALGGAAARAILDRPRRAPVAPPPEGREIRPPSAATREALWEHAGLERDAAGLGRLADDAHPLARAVARGALAREESRGGHRRRDFPERDPGLDHRHAVVGDPAGPAGPVRLERWD